MKTARRVLKIIAASLCGVAGILAIIAYWDKLTSFFGCRSGDEEEIMMEDDFV